MKQIYIIHENDEWVVPLREALAERALPYTEWFLHEGLLDLSEAPPEGVFYNRMSASSHTRDHRYAVEHTSCVLPWLEAHGRRVLNGSAALAIEVNKVAQAVSLEALGVKTPNTITTVGKDALLEAAHGFSGQFITKHNRAGKGLGVRLFQSPLALSDYVKSGEFEPPIDGVTLLQDYIQAPEPFITRVELVGREFIYAVRVDTSDGFELCPADVCIVGDANCPAIEPSGIEAAAIEAASAQAKFQIIEGFDSPLIPKFQAFMERHDIHIAGFEFIVDADGVPYCYDVNTNTNYNSAAEDAHDGPRGMQAIADYLGQQLRQVSLSPAELSADETSRPAA